MDPFDVLQLPPRFDLADAAIEQAYFTKVAAVHPDLAVDDAALEQSAALNDAKAALLDPEQRANALLARLGGPSKEQDKSLPPTFLMEVMEAREGLQAAHDTNDAAELARWKDWAAAERTANSAKVAELFKQGTPANLRAIRTTLNAWRYIERMIEQLEPTSGKAAP